MKIPVLIYHNVLASEDLSRKNQRERFYSISSGTFDKHISILKAQGFQTIKTEAPVSEINRPVILTFDDGFQSAYRCHRILNDHGFYGIFFIVTDFVGQGPYLSWREIREMDSNGMSIQSHTCTHPILSAISEEQLRMEFCKSKALLEDKLEHSIDSLSIPQGFVNGKVIDVARQCGYQYIFTSQPGFYVPGSRRAIPRFTIYNHTTSESFCRLVRRSTYEVARQRARKWILNIPKHLLGDRFYHRARLLILQWLDN
jgi:peptidoglycan/xylan/chitin deacetylase (PgdA/CDA1 family)